MKTRSTCNVAASKLVTDASADKDKICAAYPSTTGCQPADCCAEDSIKASIKAAEELYRPQVRRYKWPAVRHVDHLCLGCGGPCVLVLRHNQKCFLTERVRLQQVESMACSALGSFNLIFCETFNHSKHDLHSVVLVHNQTSKLQTFADSGAGLGARFPWWPH